MLSSTISPGKTGAYALSALQLLLTQSPPLPCSVLVLVPTKTLAVQTTKVFQNLMKWCSQLSVVSYLPFIYIQSDQVFCDTNQFQDHPRKILIL